MTLLEPSLFVRRLVVLKDSRSVADLSFHHGVNVITGENSAGKTTLVRFLAFSLGAENIDFNQTALLCSGTMVEVEANGAILTLRRDLTGKALAPLSIFWGSLDDATRAGMSAWQTFPFKRSETKISFSQLLFKALGLPELRGEAGSNITMHQILRLIYSDQETPGAELFRAEKFDSPITRQAIGEFLLGIDDNELYELQLRANALEKEDAGLASALRSVFAALGQAETNLSLEFLDLRLNEIGGELEFLTAKLAEKKELAGTGKATVVDDDLRSQLTATHAELSALKDKRVDLDKQLSDSALFVQELQNRIASIEESQAAASYLGGIKFSVCPCCLTNIAERPSTSDTCHLCNSPIDPSGARTQLARMQAELALQAHESKAVIAEMTSDRDRLDRDISALSQSLAVLEERFRRSKITWRSNDEVEREAMLTRIGGLDQEMKQLIELRKLAQSLDQQQQQRAAVAYELSKVRDQINAVRSRQQNRRLEAYECVARHLKKLLRSDVPRQPEFISADDINFDFGSNRITVDSQQQFAASSMVYLRHSFRLALLFGALEKSYFRHPRLVIVDGMEDGGMEPDRSFNFQELILGFSQAQRHEHQIILTTSTIAAALDSPEYVIGRKFSHEQRSLEIK
jgi:hypothetical protein